MKIELGSRSIGANSPCFLVAEIGVNHNGDYDLAQKMVIAAAQAGADAVKFQNYHTEDFLSEQNTLAYRYQNQGHMVTEAQWAMFKRYEPPASWLPRLKQLCDQLQIIFFSTPTSPAGVDELVNLGVPLLKNGSDYLTHLPLIRYMGSTGVPIILSTGMADQADVDAAVTAIRDGGPSPLILLHCTSTYPTPATSTNLRRMLTLQQAYQVPTGFSDHTEGFQAACQAVTLGSVMIEKHFTLDHQLPGPDHWFSSTPTEFAQLVREVRDAEVRLGQAALLPDPSESTGRSQYRLSAVAARELPVGTELTSDLVVYRRPGTGLLAKDLHSFLGRTLRRQIAAGEPFHPEDFRDDQHSH